MTTTTGETASIALVASARDVLRTATRTHHARLDGSLRLAAPDLTRREYVATLHAFLVAHDAIETALDAHVVALGSVGIDWPSRRRAHLLRRDLDALASPAIARPVPSPRARPPAAPVLTALSHALGALYVLEGSVLGGKVIARNLARIFEMDRTSGAAFFGNDGQPIHERWPTFCASLERHLAPTPHDPTAQVVSAVRRREATFAAQATFDLFIACTRPLVENPDAAPNA